MKVRNESREVSEHRCFGEVHHVTARTAKDAEEMVNRHCGLGNGRCWGGAVLLEETEDGKYFECFWVDHTSAFALND